MQNFRVEQKVTEIFPNLNLKFPIEQDEPKVVRTDFRDFLISKNQTIFQLDNLLTALEVDILNRSAENLGFESIAKEYPRGYRDCTRVVAMSKFLGDLIWKRIIPIFQKSDLNNVTPSYKGSEGKWIATSVNPCFRFSKYSGHGKFSRHKDGGYDISTEHRSIFSLIVYLSQDFDGGQTKFYSFDPESQCVTVQPRIGRAIIFNHDIEHEGLEVHGGTKLIFRTDVMFHRIESHSQLTTDALSHHEEITAQMLYARSIALRKNGDSKGSTDAYLAAERIHHRVDTDVKQKKLPEQKTSTALRKVHTPFAISNFIFIFPFLLKRSKQEERMVSCSKCGNVSIADKYYFFSCRKCHEYHSAYNNTMPHFHQNKEDWIWLIKTLPFLLNARDRYNNNLWQKLFLYRWHTESLYRETILPDSRWYHFFRDEWVARYANKIIFVSFGSSETQYGMLGMEVKLFPKNVPEVRNMPRNKISHCLQDFSCLPSKLYIHYNRSYSGYRAGISGISPEVPYLKNDETADTEECWKDGMISLVYSKSVIRYILQKGFELPLSPKRHPILALVPSFLNKCVFLIVSLTLTFPIVF